MSGPMRIALCWSGGKDAAWALHVLRQSGDGELVGLITSVVPAFGRVAMHGVRVELVRAQAAAAGLPLLEVELPWPCPNERYEAAFEAALRRAGAVWGATHVAAGDLFLADVRAYRERLVAGAGLEPLFPLWGRPTDRLLDAMLAAGVRARIVCLDPARVSRDLAGRVLDSAVRAALGPEVDPCGERGEFHTFVTHGPMLARPVGVSAGAVVERDGFVYADLVSRPSAVGHQPSDHG